MESRVWSGVSSLYQADLVQAVRQSADPEVDSDWLVVVVVVMVVCSLYVPPQHLCRSVVFCTGLGSGSHHQSDQQI